VKPQACGTGRTAANVPVEIEVDRGPIRCASGRLPGNGGGGPVVVDGWKCSGFNTPELLKTGDVSKCVKGGVEFVAILKSPS
jgi:hypothetical protein